MSHKLSNGALAHQLSTDKLVDLFQEPPKPKDKNVVAAVLRARGVNVQRFLFLKSLAGNKPLEVGDTAYTVMPAGWDYKVREVLLVGPGTPSYPTFRNERTFDVKFIDGAIPMGTFRAVPEKKLFRTRKEALASTDEH